MAFELLEFKALARVLIDDFVHDGLRRGLGRRANDLLTLEVLAKVLCRSAENFAVEQGKGLVALGAVDFVRVVVEGSFESIELALIQGAPSLAFLKILDEKLLERADVFLAKEGGACSAGLL